MNTVVIAMGTLHMNIAAGGMYMDYEVRAHVRLLSMFCMDQLLQCEFKGSV